MLANALYYPWMHFQDDEWVKRSLLTWDKLIRVRARDVDDRDSELVRQLRAETDFLKEISPSGRDLYVVNSAFSNILHASERRLAERYGTEVPWPGDLLTHWDAPESNTGFGAADRDDLTWIYARESGTKVAEALRDGFVERGLARYDGGWLGMRPKLASIYLATLADVIADSNLLSPVTDDPRMHRAAGALDRLAALLLDDEEGPALADPTGAYIHLALDAVIVPADVPVGKLIRFRDKHTAELTAFREHVASLADELREVAAVENLEIAHAHLESLYRKHTKPQLDELRRALRGQGVASTAGSLGLKVDVAAGTVAGSIAAAGGQLAVAGTAIAMSVIPYLASRYKAAREIRRTSPVAYLLAAHKLSR